MTTVATKNFTELSANEREAILTLLEDEDPMVESLLVERLVSFGPSVLEWLAPLQAREGGVMGRRIDLVREQLERGENDALFMDFCTGAEDEMDLEAGVWCFVRSEFPLISVDGYKALIDSFAEVLKDRLESVEGGESTFAVVNQYLFGELEFSGNDDDYYDPQNSYLNRVIDRRLGIPITLSVLLLFIARRLRLPVTGIGMPGHFLCRYQTPREEFYIDVFNRGRLLSKSECIRFLSRTEYGYRDDFLSPVSTRAILLRICQNLLQIHRQANRSDAAARMTRYVNALARRR